MVVYSIKVRMLVENISSKGYNDNVLCRRMAIDKICLVLSMFRSGLTAFPRAVFLGTEA